MGGKWKGAATSGAISFGVVAGSGAGLAALSIFVFSNPVGWATGIGIVLVDLLFPTSKMTPQK